MTMVQRTNRTGSAVLARIRHALGSASRDPVRAVQLVRKRFERPRVPQNTSFCYVREDEEMSTTIYLFNYWSENYKIPQPEIDFTLLRMDGTEAGTYSIQLPPNGSRGVRIREVLDANGLQPPFEGSVLTRIIHPNLVEGRPLQMHADYVYANGARVTGVHSQWGIPPFPKQELLASFHVDVRPGIDTHVVLRNTLQKKGTKSGTIHVRLTNYRGEDRHAEVKGVPPHGMKRVEMRTIFPDAESFLGGRPGNLEVSTHAVMGRCLFYHHSMEDQAYCFNHATESLVVNGAGHYSLAEMRLMGIGPVAAGPIYVRGGLDTYVLPFVDFPPGISEYAFDLTVFNASGEEVARTHEPLVLHPGAVPILRFKELLPTMGIKLPFEGSFRLSYHLREETPTYIKGFHFIAGHQEGSYRTEYQWDAGLFNMPTHNLSNEYQTTKVFCRILVNDRFKTSVFLVNPSGERGYSRSTKTNLTIFNPEGNVIGEKLISLPPNGSVTLDLEEHFPGVRERLSPWGGSGIFKVRDTTSRVTGFHYVQDRHGNYLAADHLFGG